MAPAQRNQSHAPHGLTDPWGRRNTDTQLREPSGEREALISLPSLTFFLFSSSLCVLAAASFFALLTLSYAACQGTSTTVGNYRNQEGNWETGNTTTSGIEILAAGVKHLLLLGLQALPVFEKGSWFMFLALSTWNQHLPLS